MEPREFLRIMGTAEKLKCNTRHSWTSNGRRESVADHSWRLSFMAMLVADEFPEDSMYNEERLMIKSAYPDGLGCFIKRFPDIIKVQSVNETGELNQDIPTLIVGFDAAKKLLGDELITTILTRERNEKFIAARENVFFCPGLNDNLKESRDGVYQFIDKVQRDVLLGNLVKAINKLLENGYDDDLIHILDRKLRDTRYKTEMEYMFK